jgi:L-rhamnose mutarotase
MNCNRTTKYLILLFLFLSIDGISQPNIFEWQGETCSYKSKFNTSKYTLEEIKNVYDLLNSDTYTLKTETVFKVDDYKKLNVDKLNRDYNTVINTLNNLKVPNQNIWNELVNLKIKEINQIYKVTLIKYDVFLNNNFKALTSFWKKDSCMENYTTLLKQEEIIKAWEFVTTEIASKNCCPDKIWDKFKYKKSQGNWFQLAKIDIITFGWGNCANKYIFRVNDSEYYTDFNSLFLSTEEFDCMEF